jgi:hypothetical protein
MDSGQLETEGLVTIPAKYRHPLQRKQQGQYRVVQPKQLTGS